MIKALKPPRDIALLLGLSVITLFLSGCVSTTGGYSESKKAYPVGPRSISEKQETSDEFKKRKRTELSILVLPLDPSIPEDSDNFAKKNIWPELRRAEANHFAVKLREALTKTEAFSTARVVPDKNVTGDLYMSGKIVKSNGEDVEISVSVMAINGETFLRNKIYNYRVKEYELDNPRNDANYDIYDPVFEKIAEDVAKIFRKLTDDDVATLRLIEKIRFAESFSPEYFSPYLETSRRGITRLTAAPADQDMMFLRSQELRIRDLLFVDNLQQDYDNFSRQMWDGYSLWQRESYFESNAGRKTRLKGIGKKILGAAALAGGIALVATSDPFSGGGQALGGSLIAAAGVASIGSGMSDSADAKMHRASMNELGRSLNIQLAPRVINFENQTIKLKGDAAQQYETWRLFLKDLYQLDKTPNISL